MRKYKVVAVLWEDHTTGNRKDLPVDPDSLIEPTLTIGVLAKKTKKTLTVVSDIEKYPDRVDTTYWVLLRRTVLSVKEFGEIELENL